MSEFQLGDPAPLERSNTRYQILALSGGGFRGFFSAEVLARIEGATPMRGHFDLITGTSIGGIIACAIAVGVPAARVRDAIAEHGPRIFPRRKRLQRYFRAPYSASALAEVVEDALGKPNSRLQLNQIDTALLLPTVSETGARPRLLRSRGLAGEEASACTLLEAALATGAAPTYFPARRMGNETLVDGGLIANAPELVALTEAMRWRRTRADDIRILSIGTAGANPAKVPEPAHTAGILSWIVGRDLVELTLTAQERLAVSQCSTLLGERYLRIDAQPSPAQQKVLALDAADKKATATLSLLVDLAVSTMTAETKGRLKALLENRVS